MPAGGSLLSVGLLWGFQGLNLWLHYITFFYCCSHGARAQPPPALTLSHLGWLHVWSVVR